MGIETKMKLVKLIYGWVLYNKEIRNKIIIIIKKKTRGLASKVHANDDYGTTPESQTNLEN